MWCISSPQDQVICLFDGFLVNQDRTDNTSPFISFLWRTLCWVRHHSSTSGVRHMTHLSSSNTTLKPTITRLLHGKNTTPTQQSRRTVCVSSSVILIHVRQDISVWLCVIFGHVYTYVYTWRSTIFFYIYNENTTHVIILENREYMNPWICSIILFRYS